MIFSSCKRPDGLWGPDGLLFKDGASFLEYKSDIRVKLIRHLYVVPTLRINGAHNSSTSHNFMVRADTNLHFLKRVSWNLERNPSERNEISN